MKQENPKDRRLVRNGGKREQRFSWEMPEMGKKTPHCDPKGHWGRVQAHLRSVNPANEQGRRKARKMLARVAG